MHKTESGDDALAILRQTPSLAKTNSARIVARRVSLRIQGVRRRLHRPVRRRYPLQGRGMESGGRVRATPSGEERLVKAEEAQVSTPGLQVLLHGVPRAHHPQPRNRQGEA